MSDKKNSIDLIKQLEEIKILERFVIQNIRNPAISIEHHWHFSHVKNEAEEQQVIQSLQDNGNFSISDEQKALLELGLQQHYFDKTKFIELPIEDRLYRHYDTVLLAIKKFKDYIASDDYLQLTSPIIELGTKNEWPELLKEAQNAYQQAFQFYARHMDCRSVEIPAEIFEKIKKIQAQAYKDQEIKEMVRVHLQPQYRAHIEEYISSNKKKNRAVDILFDTEIDVEYETKILPVIQTLFEQKRINLLDRQNTFKHAQNKGSYSYTYMPRKKDVKGKFIKTGIQGAPHIKRLDDRLKGCKETLEKLRSANAIPYIHKNILQNFYQWKHQLKDHDDPQLSLYEKVKKTCCIVK
ncbi:MULTISPECIES: hypothetical protein [Acinetobacter]|uniref:hypothetical protein n=1 Tax=Acinetobacter TaxID=469 RepID=UPI0026757006|nr:hypothetical protein [Acinetobacter higginsii]MDO3664159.1 hypothetical protein [Acinetobacter higginsii]